MTGTGLSEDAEPVPFLFISFRVTTMNQKVMFFCFFFFECLLHDRHGLGVSSAFSSILFFFSQ